MRYKTDAYDCECAIEMLTACNYRCEYCSGPRVKKRVRRGRSVADIDQVIAFFNSSDRKWLLGLSGGEPTVHPQFARLVAGLSERHLFYLFTNLTFDLDPFLELLPPEKVQFMKTSLHPQGDTETFLRKYEVLFDRGYNPVLIMVSAPDQFDRVREVSDFCAAREYPFTLSVMEGPYQNRNYPNDYTDDEAAFIERHTHEPGNLVRLFSRTPGGMNTFGMVCPAGRSSFVLDLESGDLTSCESLSRGHGNVYEGRFTPSEQDVVCPAINSCVGYDRSSRLPHAYSGFFRDVGGALEVNGFKTSPDYPANLVRLLSGDAAGARDAVAVALEKIHELVQGRRVFFWGAGVYGAKILYSLRERFGGLEDSVVGFVDSLPDRQRDTVLGLAVHSPRNAAALAAVDRILITSFAFEQDILDAGRDLGVEAKMVPLHRDILKPLGIESGIF